MNIKKLGFAFLVMALLVVASVAVMAQEEATYGPAKEYGKHMISVKFIENYMDEYDLSEESTIGELIEAIEKDKEAMRDEAKENYGVETDEELKEAIYQEKINRLREEYGLDEEDYTDEEVVEYVKEYHFDELKDLLDLPEDASEEEVKEALQEWREEHKPLLGPKWKFRFWGWLK